MHSPGKDLGTMKPIGGGDPIPLKKPELVLGRRPSCDVMLDFENVSGKHCTLRYHNQVWHVRDMGSTNGTTVNGAKISSEHSVMPDDEIGIAGHFFKIDYEAGAPASILNKEHAIEDELLETHKKKSLMELAGLDTDDDRRPKKRRPTKAPAVIERLSAEEGEFEDALPEHFKAAPAPRKPEEVAADDDFLKLVEEDVLKAKQEGKG